jgi:hypothetical protein
LLGAMMSGRGFVIIEARKQYKMECSESSVLPAVCPY